TAAWIILHVILLIPPTMANNNPSNRDSVDSITSSKKPSAEMSRSGSTSSGLSPFDRAPQRTFSHDDNAAVASLAAPPEEEEHAPATTFRDMWPKQPRAYLCLFGGFMQMFVSWGYVNVGLASMSFEM
ncbi:hypothetical protein LTR53_018402, partial [Teratosphaeriaceae sp. CCFEE 6253]